MCVAEFSSCVCLLSDTKIEQSDIDIDKRPTKYIQLVNNILFFPIAKMNVNVYVF